MEWSGQQFSMRLGPKALPATPCLTRSSNLVRLSFYYHTNADGLLEGPTADKCEKGGLLMSDNPVFAYRREIQDYLRSCEHLLAAAVTSPQPFTKEELAMVGYYAAEIQKILPVSAER